LLAKQGAQSGLENESNTGEMGRRQLSDGNNADTGGHAPPARHLAAVAGSIAAHALIFAAIIFAASRARPNGHHWVLAYVIDLGAAPGSGGKQGGLPPVKIDSGAASPPEQAAPIPRVARPALRRRLPRRVREAALAPAPPTEIGPAAREDHETTHADSPSAAAPDSAAGNRLDHPSSDANASGTGGHGIATGAGSGPGSAAGSGAGGSTVARADYGSDPAPLYPARSRRRGEQGTVLLHVLIAADGAVERVELSVSSGFRDLDQTAIYTVRSRWKFVPARRDGIAIESWVIVPIRFALTEASN
jgi:protein TonB